MPVVEKFKDAYGYWHVCLPHFPKSVRYTLGSRIDSAFLDAIESAFLAGYGRDAQKLALLDRAVARLDLLKLMAQLAWETRALDTKKIALLAERLAEIGRMLGGWRRQAERKLPAEMPGETGR